MPHHNLFLKIDWKTGFHQEDFQLHFGNLVNTIIRCITINTILDLSVPLKNGGEKIWSTHKLPSNYHIKFNLWLACINQLPCGRKFDTNLILICLQIYNNVCFENNNPLFVMWKVATYMITMWNCLFLLFIMYISAPSIYVWRNKYINSNPSINYFNMIL